MTEAGTLARGPGEMMGNAGPGMLAGLRVIEMADERAEYTGLLLAGLGAEVDQDRTAGGQRDAADRPVSRGSAGPGALAVLLELQPQQEIGRARSARARRRASSMLRLLGGADILLDASCGALNEVLGLDHAALNARFPQLVTARMTPFGDDGPWKDFKGSDLIHLALGGPMMNCGYDPDPNFEYDTPPIAPQIWHAYHIAGEQMATGIIAALIHRERSGEGQDVSLAIHEAVSKNPEQDLMYWVCRRVPLWRLTCRHASEGPNHSPSICHTKDGRWFITHGMGARDLKNLVPLLSKYNAQADLQPPAARGGPAGAAGPGNGGSRRSALAHARRRAALCPRLDLQGHAVARGAECRAAVGAAAASRTRTRSTSTGWARKTFAEIEHPELGRSFLYPTSKWLSNKTSWQVGRRAPLLGEDTEAVLGEAARRPERAGTAAQGREPAPLGAAQQAVPAAGHQDFRLRVVSRLGRRHAVSRRDGRRELQGRVEGQSRHAAGGNGAGRRPRRARCGDRAAARGQGPRHGRQFPQQELRQARHLAQHPPPEGLADRQGHDPHLRCRGRGVLARRLAAPGPRLRRAEVDPAGHHLHPAIGDGRARHLWPHAHGRPGGGGVWRPGRDVGPARAGDAGELGLLLPRLDGRLWLCAGIARRDLSPRAHRRGPVDRRLAMRERHFPDRRHDPRLVGQ